MRRRRLPPRSYVLALFAGLLCLVLALPVHWGGDLVPRRADKAADAAARVLDAVDETSAVLAGLQSASARDKRSLERVLAASLGRLRAEIAATGDAQLAALGEQLAPAGAARLDPRALEAVAVRGGRLAAGGAVESDREAERAARGALGALLASAIALAAFALFGFWRTARDHRTLERVLPKGASGEGLVARAERLAGKYQHAFDQQVSLVGECAELSRALGDSEALEQRLRHEVRLNRDRIEKLEVAQMNDELTGVLNFKYFLLRLGEALDDFLTNERQFCLLALDLDNFKSINDGFGHHVGDAALKELARVLASSVREQDVVFRKSGDEFYVLLPGSTADHGVALAERLIGTINGHIVTYESGDEVYRVALGTSIGVLHCSEVDPKLLRKLKREQLLSETYGFADAALFKAKYSGKGCARIYRAGLTVKSVNPEEYPPEFDRLHRDLKARYPHLPPELQREFNEHVAVCRTLLDPSHPPAIHGKTCGAPRAGMP